MSQYLPEVAWRTLVSNVRFIHDGTKISTDYRYYVDVFPLNINDPGANGATIDIQIDDWLIDYAGYPFLIEDVVETGDLVSGNPFVLKVYDVNERSWGNEDFGLIGPYEGKDAFIYRTKNGAFLLTQAQLRYLDTSAKDVIQPVEKAVIWAYRGLQLDDGTTDLTNVTKLTLDGFTLVNNSLDGWQGGSELTLSTNKMYLPDGTNPFVYTGTNPLTTNAALYIDGDIIQNGSAYETHAERIYTKKDAIILRDGAISGLSAGKYTGLVAKLYDGTNDGGLIYDSGGIARIGDLTYDESTETWNIANTQPIATRIESPTNNYVAVWESANLRLNFVERLAKSQLPTTIVYTDQTNTYGDFAQSFKDNIIRIYNPADTYYYTITAGAIGANRILNLPVITATDTIAVLALAQTFTNKTLTSSTNVLGRVTMTLGSDANGDIYYRASNTLTRLAKAATGNVLLSGDAPSWGKVDLTTHISGTLAVSNGGTNISSYTAGDLLYATDTTTLSKLEKGSALQLLRMKSDGTLPEWATIPTMDYPLIIVSSWAEFKSAVTTCNTYGGGQIIISGTVTVTDTNNQDLTGIMVSGGNILFDYSPMYVSTDSSIFFENVNFTYLSNSGNPSPKMLIMTSGEKALFFRCLVQGYLTMNPAINNGYGNTHFLLNIDTPSELNEKAVTLISCKYATLTNSPTFLNGINIYLDNAYPDVQIDVFGETIPFRYTNPENYVYVSGQEPTNNVSVSTDGGTYVHCGPSGTNITFPTWTKIRYIEHFLNDPAIYGLDAYSSETNILYYNTTTKKLAYGVPLIPSTITVADEASDTTCFPLFATAATGDLAPKTNASLTFNSSTEELGVNNLKVGTYTKIRTEAGLVTGNDSIIENEQGTNWIQLRAVDTKGFLVRNSTDSGANYTEILTVYNTSLKYYTYDIYHANNANLSTVDWTGNTLTAYTGIVPDANDGAYLGTTALGFSDLFLASGGVVNWNNGDVTLTHSANVLRFDGGSLGLGTAPDVTFHVYRNATIGNIGTPTVTNAGVHIQDSSYNMYLDGNSILFDGSSYISTTGATTLYFGTNNTRRLLIAADGQITLDAYTTAGYLKNSAAGLLSSQAVPIPVADGGTNQTTYTQGDILYADTTNSLQKLARGTSASNTQVLHQDYTNRIPEWKEFYLILDAFSALTSNSSVTWNCNNGLNRTWSINGNYTLTISNIANGMSGDCRIVVTSTATVTLSTGLTNKGNGSLTSLPVGVYHLCWVSDGTNFDWNISSYS